MNIKLRKKAKDYFYINFFKSIINSMFGKTMENVRNHRKIKFVPTDKIRIKFVSERNYCTIEPVSVCKFVKSRYKQDSRV